LSAFVSLYCLASIELAVLALGAVFPFCEFIRKCDICRQKGFDEKSKVIFD